MSATMLGVKRAAGGGWVDWADARSLAMSGCGKESMSVLGGRVVDGGATERRSALEATTAIGKGIGLIFPPAEWLRVPAGRSHNPRFYDFD
jgi:hypothetical protein